MANYHNRGNNYNRGGGGGGGYHRNFSGHRSNNEYEKDNSVFVQEDTIFVSGMNPETSETEIADRFGSIGIIKKDKRTQKLKIWIYKDKETGNGKGECTITYDDPHTASSAIEWFDGKDFNGSTIRVQLAQRNTGSSSWSKGGGQRKPIGGGVQGQQNSSHIKQDKSDSRGGSGGGNHREGDWNCAECSNKNFAWRNECNRCKTPKSNGGSRGENNSGRNYDHGGASGGKSYNNSRHRPY